MSNSVQDYQIAALAAGFTIGFGFLTVWEAIKQTRRNHNPLRSVYIYMVWGEILANLLIAIVGWLFLNGVLGPTVPVLFLILFLWVFEIQLLMQIIINRLTLIVEHQSTVTKIKWGTVVLITAINIAVFIIWIPAHTVPPVSQTFVLVNNVWDKASKVLILLVDAGLNWYFLRTVNIRLVQQHGLTKFKPLVSFNAKLMVVSIGMDVLLIGLMFLKNQVVYIQFHPVVYIVKLKIEMSMASLVVRIAKGRPENDMDPEDNLKSSPNHTSHPPMKATPLAGLVRPSTGVVDSRPTTGSLGVQTSISAVRTTPSVGTSVMTKGKAQSKVNLYPQPFANIMVIEKKLPQVPRMLPQVQVPAQLHSVFEDDKSPKKGVMHVFMHHHSNHHRI